MGRGETEGDIMDFAMRPGRNGEKSNYVKVLEQWRAAFVTWDHEAICRKLHMTDYDEERIRLPYFGIPHYVERKTGKIGRMDKPGHEAGFDEVMSIYSLLYYSGENAVNSGEWVHFRDVKSAGVFEDAFERQVLKPFARFFSGKPEKFRAAGEKLGFTPLAYGDGAFQVPAFPCIPIRVIFWDSDEEFPASVNLLFDRNIIKFTHPESVVMLGNECMRYFFAACEEKKEMI